VTAAWVAGATVPVSDVDDRERALRSGPASTAMPMADSSEGRQLRRWLVQLMAAERLVAVEAERRGVTAAGAPALDELADRPGLLELGSVAAALLSQGALARALFLAVTEHVGVAEDRIERYYTGNPEQFTIPERRTVRHTTNKAVRVEDCPLRTLRRGELTGAVERAVFAAAPGEVVGPVEDPLGWHLLRLEATEPARVRPLAEVRDEIARRLLAGARRRAFIAWLDGKSAELVRLAPGYEHPGDPSQPDNTHRH
jgi:[acyl-carrier-protein] S-malonyltransferase